jgi:hypothetical protein
VTEPNTAAGSRAPGTLRAAVVLLAGQAVAIAAVTGYLAYRDLADHTSLTLTLTGFCAALAALLGFLGYSLARRRAWARGPAIVLELMLLPIGYYMIKGGVPWLGVAVLLLALCTAGLLLAPATRATLGVH